MDTQLAIQKMADPRLGESTQPFAYPPFTALVLMPLGWLPFSGAFAVMTLVNVGLLSVVLLFLIRKLGLVKATVEMAAIEHILQFWCP